MQLQDVLKPIEHRWLEFGLKVGIQRRILDSYSGKPAPLSLVIDHWWGGNVKEGLPVTWKSVVVALEKMDASGLAETISAEYCQQQQ